MKRLLLTAAVFSVLANPGWAASRLTFTLPAELNAGNELSFQVTVPIADGSQVTAMAIGSSGPVVRTLEVQGGKTSVSFGRLESAGRWTIHVAGGGLAGTATVDVKPGTTTDALSAVVNPTRTRSGEVVLAAIPEDEFGNVLAEGSPATLVVNHPGAPPMKIEQILTNQVVVMSIPAGTVAGTVSMLLRMPGRSEHLSFIREAENPGPFTLRARRHTPADGFTPFEISSTYITDSTGNPPVDGTAVTIEVTWQDGSRSLYPGLVIDGRVDAVITAPSVSQTVEIVGNLGGYRTEPLSVFFARRDPL